MNRLLVILIALFATTAGAASDSTAYYRELIGLSRRYFEQMQADSFVACTRQLGQYLSRQKQKDAELEMHYEMQQGVYEVKMHGDMASGIDHYRRALALIDSTGCGRDQLIIVLTNLADAYNQAGQYDCAVEYFLKAMDFDDDLDDRSRITIAIGFATTYTFMGSFEQSRNHWLHAAALQPRMNRQELFQYLNNRGNDYFLQADYEQALQCFLQLDSLTDGDPDMLWERMFGHINLSDIYINLGQPERARPLLDETEDFFTKYDLQTAIYYLKTQRMELALSEGRTSDALALIRELPTDEPMIPSQRLLRLKAMTKTYKQAGRWRECALTMQRFHLLQDSVASDQMKMRLAALYKDYQHQKELKAKELEMERHRLDGIIMLISLVATTVVVVLLCIIILMKRRQQRLKEAAMQKDMTLLRMETVRNRITPHFIGNVLSAQMLAQMEGRTVDLNPLVELLNRGVEMTGTELITLQDELAFIRFYCDVQGPAVLGDDFRLNIDLDGVDPTQVQLPSMFIQIAVENSIKHGLRAMPRREGHLRQIWIVARRHRQGTLVEIIDNGTGFIADRARRFGTGLTVLRRSIAMLNAQNREQMDYGCENYKHPDGDTGCRAWLYLPDNFNYKLD